MHILVLKHTYLNNYIFYFWYKKIIPRILLLCFRYVSQLPFVNEDKLAVTGVSYGGYITMMMLSEPHENLIACGVAVSPVVDWRFYGKGNVHYFFSSPRLSSSIIE